VRVADGPLNQERIGDVREAASRDRHDLQGAGLVPAVFPFPGGVRDRRLFPVQRVWRGENSPGWLPLTAVNR